MITLPVFTIKGTKVGEMGLPENLTAKENLNILSQAIRVYEDRSHLGLSKVKTRGEVRASTRKIYRQKGTGGARHGAISAPIFVGGGVAHGPKGVKRILKLSKSLKRKSLAVAITLKAKNNEVVVVDSITSLKKTKEAFNLVSKINPGSKKELHKVTFILSEKNIGVSKVVNNLRNAASTQFRNINAYSVLYGGLLILDKEALQKQEPKVGEPKKKTPPTKRVPQAKKTKKVSRKTPKKGKK